MSATAVFGGGGGGGGKSGGGGGGGGGAIKQGEKWGRVKLRSRSMQPKNVMASYSVRAADKALTYSHTAT